MPRPSTDSDEEIDAAVVERVRPVDAGWIGLSQVLALFAGICRSGITMVAGLARGLDHEQAVRFTFLLATPIILAAGVLKIPDFTGPLGDGIRGQALAGAVAAFIAALLVHGVPDPLLPDNKLTPFGDLLPGLRGRQHHPLRLTRLNLSGPAPRSVGRAPLTGQPNTRSSTWATPSSSLLAVTSSATASTSGWALATATE